MAKTAANVRVGVSGALFYAPLGTTLPTSAESALDAAFVEVGYVSEDGVTQAMSSDVSDIKAWGGDIVRKVQTSHDLTYQCSMLETNDHTQRIYYADTDATADAVRITSAQSGRFSWVFQVLDGDDEIRIVLPDGQVTERGDLSYKGDEAIMYDITVTAYPDVSGVKSYIYGTEDGS